MLVDVRSRPYSRHNPQFDRPVLTEALAEDGIIYYWGGKILGGLNSISVNDPVFIERMGAVVTVVWSRRHDGIKNWFAIIGYTTAP